MQHRRTCFGVHCLSKRLSSVVIFTCGIIDRLEAIICRKIIVYNNWKWNDNHFSPSTQHYEVMYVVCLCYLLDMQQDDHWNLSGHGCKERYIFPHFNFNLNLNITLVIWPIVVISSDCTVPGHEWQVTTYAFHEHFSFFFTY